MSTSTMTARLIGQHLHGWMPTRFDDETDPYVRWEVVTTFNHDWEYHILVQQWAVNSSGTFDRAGYSLWFIHGIDGERALVEEWPDADRPPLLAAAELVVQHTDQRH